ncbi:MAG TPA: sensor histidine kinase, partial [Terriglobales bacterium]
MAQEEERKRLASELHDDFGQRTALLEFAVEKLRKNIEQGTGVSEAIDLLRSDVGELARALRESSHRLHPSSLENLGLCAAIAVLVEEHQRVGHAVTMFDRDVPSTLPTQVSTALYRIVQEALHNASKHVPDAPVRVSLIHENGDLRLSIVDAGPGFDVRQARKKDGLGLLSMQERVRSIAGTMTIDSTPEDGTAIKICVPLSEPNQSSTS